MFEQLKMTFKVSEIKLVKLLIALVEKNTLFKRYCVVQTLLFIAKKQLRYNKIKLI